MRVVKYALLSLVGLLILAAVLVSKYFLVDFKVVNNTSLANFKVSTVVGNLLLWRMGYREQIDTVVVTFTDLEQDGFAFVSESGTILSISTKEENRHIDVFVHYSPDEFERLAEFKPRFSIDALTGICLALEGREIRGDCFSKANENLVWAEGYHLGTFVTIKKPLLSSLLSSIVPQAFAQSCVGSIKCGRWEQMGWCSISPVPCRENNDCTPYGLGTCQDIQTRCNLDGSTLNCAPLSTDQTQCQKALQSLCMSYCNTLVEYPCTWVPPYNPPPPVPPPITPPSNPPPNPTQWFGCVNNACSVTTWSSKEACQAAACSSLPSSTISSWSDSVPAPSPLVITSMFSVSRETPEEPQNRLFVVAASSLDHSPVAQSLPALTQK